MSSIERILANIETFLGTKLKDEVEKERLISELSSTATDLIQHPQLPARKRLLALFKRFGIEEAIAGSLVKSLLVGISKEREDAFDLATQHIDSIQFPLLEENRDLVIARARDVGPNMALFPDDKVFGLIEEAAVPFAQLLGSNVAEALAVQDPVAVFRGKILVQSILHGEKRDPIEIANLFIKLGPEKKRDLISLISEKVTRAQEAYRGRHEQLLRNGNVFQWIYDRLREVNIPSTTAKQVTPVIAEQYSIEELDNMDARRFMKLAIDMISGVSLQTD